MDAIVLRVVWRRLMGKDMSLVRGDMVVCVVVFVGDIVAMPRRPSNIVSRVGGREVEYDG